MLTQEEIDNWETTVTLRKVQSRKFKTKEQASKWAKDEKKKKAPQESFSWETNRLEGDQPMKWEATIYKDV